MTDETPIVPPDRLERNPLITEAGYRTFDRIRQHPYAPVWNYEVGDRVQAEDLPLVESFRAEVFSGRRAGTGAPPPEKNRMGRPDEEPVAAVSSPSSGGV